jgi:hypothetical protein
MSRGPEEPPAAVECWTKILQAVIVWVFWRENPLIMGVLERKPTNNVR